MSGLDYVLHDGTPMLRLPNSPKTISRTVRQLMAEAVGYEPAADYTEFEDWAEDPTLKTVEGAER